MVGFSSFYGLSGFFGSFEKNGRNQINPRNKINQLISFYLRKLKSISLDLAPFPLK
jgi:CRISPR/Cas system-associated endonuclease Cas1